MPKTKSRAIAKREAKSNILRSPNAQGGYENPNEVDHPSHYQATNGLEVIDVIESYDLDFHLGQVVKYVLRADKKGNREIDLEKATWYLKRALQVSRMASK